MLHSARINAVGKSKPKRDGASKQVKAVASTSSSKPVAPMKRSKAERRGPANLTEFPFHQRRFREARERAARHRGDLLSTFTGHEESEFKQKPTVKFRPATAALFKVSIGAQARRDITQLVQIADGDYEVGGALIGRVTGDTLRVTRALPPSKAAIATSTSIERHRDPIEIRRVIAEANHGLVELGGWHAHAHGFGEPSQTDMQTLALDHSTGIHRPIELIVRPDLAHGFAKPILRCWALLDSDDEEFDFDIVGVDLAS